MSGSAPARWREAPWSEKRALWPCATCGRELGGGVLQGHDGPRPDMRGWEPAAATVPVDGAELTAWRMSNRERRRVNYARGKFDPRVRPRDYRPPHEKVPTMPYRGGTMTIGRAFSDPQLPLLIQCTCNAWSLVRPRPGDNKGD